MVGPVVLIGTGTSVGKTYVGERILDALRDASVPALGYKPVETGFSAGDAHSDIERLRRASTFHVKPPLATQTFSDPISPHLAARREGRTLDLQRIRDEVQRACESGVRLVLVELAGGAFSPMTDDVSCAQFARSLPGARAILVAADRLGVLHDLGSTTRACAALGLPLEGIVLSGTERPDVTERQNASEIPLVTTVPLLASLPSASPLEPIGEHDPVRALARHLLAGRAGTRIATAPSRTT
jgi:dethiobiotin synthetase